MLHHPVVIQFGLGDGTNRTTHQSNRARLSSIETYDFKSPTRALIRRSNFKRRTPFNYEAQANKLSLNRFCTTWQLEKKASDWFQKGPVVLMPWGYFKLVFVFMPQ